MHITRIQGKPEAEVDEGEDEAGGTEEEEEEEELDSVWERVIVRGRAGDGVTEGERREEVIPRMKAGERYDRK